MAKLLTYTEVDALPEDKKAKYKQRVADAIALLAKYEPITTSFEVLEQGKCWGIKMKVRTYVGNHVTYESNPDSAPTKAELRRRQDEAKAKQEASRPKDPDA